MVSLEIGNSVLESRGNAEERKPFSERTVSSICSKMRQTVTEKLPLEKG
jgi:hypothetical protein